MTRRLVFIVMVLALVGGLSRLLFDGRRTNQLSRQLRDDALKFHLPPNTCLEGRLGYLTFDETLACGWSPESLPDGLEAGTKGEVDWRTGESWLRMAETTFATPGEQPAERCLDAVRFSAYLAGRGGAEGERIGSRLALLAVQPCVRATPMPNQLELLKRNRREIVEQLGPMLNAFVIDGQLRRFGSWMLAADRQALPAGMRELAAGAPPPPFNPIERNGRLAMWTRAQRVGKQLVELGTTPEANADSLITAYESEWPERVSDPKRLRAAYDEERLRANAVSLVLDAWLLGPRCALGPDATSTVRVDGTDCLLSNGKLHVQLPSRSE